MVVKKLDLYTAQPGVGDMELHPLPNQGAPFPLSLPPPLLLRDQQKEKDQWLDCPSPPVPRTVEKWGHVEGWWGPFKSQRAPFKEAL